MSAIVASMLPSASSNSRPSSARTNHSDARDLRTAVTAATAAAVALGTRACATRTLTGASNGSSALASTPTSVLRPEATAPRITRSTSRPARHIAELCRQLGDDGADAEGAERRVAVKERLEVVRDADTSSSGGTTLSRILRAAAVRPLPRSAKGPRPGEPVLDSIDVPRLVLRADNDGPAQSLELRRDQPDPARSCRRQRRLVRGRKDRVDSAESPPPSSRYRPARAERVCTCRFMRSAGRRNAAVAEVAQRATPPAHRHRPRSRSRALSHDQASVRTRERGYAPTFLETSVSQRPA